MDPDHLCRAATRSGGNCTQQAGFGTDHLGVGRCKFHGGSTPDHQLAGVVELARREAATMGRPLDIDPHEAILECIRIAAGEVAYASEQILCLEAEEAVGGTTREHDRPLKGEYGQESAGDMVTETFRDMGALNVWITVRHKAMDRLVEYSKVALHAGIQQQLVDAATKYAEQIALAMSEIVRRLGHDPTDPAVRTAMRDGLQASGSRADLQLLPGGG